MAKNMTLRLNDEDEKMLNFIKDKISYSGVSSKGVRFALEFTYKLLKVSKLKDGDYEYNFIDELNTIFKIDVDNYRYY